MLVPNTGHAAEIVTSTQGLEPSTTITECSSGGKYFPRKLRAATIRIYLGTELQGGADEYPAQGVVVEPEAGTLILQYNFDRQDCSKKMARTEHAIDGGAKAVYVKHYDNTRDETLASRCAPAPRPAPPPQPRHAALPPNPLNPRPRVECALCAVCRAQQLTMRLWPRACARARVCMCVCLCVSRRAFQTAPPDTKAGARAPYQPAVVCEPAMCRCYFDQPSMFLRASTIV